MANTYSRPIRTRGEEAAFLSNREWIPTTAAARALGVSPRTLKRYGHQESGFLIPGVHWAAGPFANSPSTWDVEA